MWCRLSRMTTVGSSVSVSSELHCSARLDKYCRSSCGGRKKTQLGLLDHKNFPLMPHYFFKFDID